MYLSALARKSTRHGTTPQAITPHNISEAGINTSRSLNERIHAQPIDSMCLELGVPGTFYSQVLQVSRLYQEPPGAARKRLADAEPSPQSKGRQCLATFGQRTHGVRVVHSTLHRCCCRARGREIVPLASHWNKRIIVTRRYIVDANACRVILR